MVGSANVVLFIRKKQTCCEAGGAVSGFLTNTEPYVDSKGNTSYSVSNGRIDAAEMSLDGQVFFLILNRLLADGYSVTVERA